MKKLRFCLAFTALFIFINEIEAQIKNEKISEQIWPSTPPPGCPFPVSNEITGVSFTGQYKNDYCDADTWYFSWGKDDKLYSPFADGTVKGKKSVCWNKNSVAGYAVMSGHDPMNLNYVSIGNINLPENPYGGRYPCGSLVYNGVWYYGSYCLMNENGKIESDIQDPQLGRINWGVMGPFCGFHIYKNLSDSVREDKWIPSPFSGEKPMFSEPVKKGGAVKIGAPHFVDFGKNMENSPDGKAYLVAHGATDDDPHQRFANLSWINGDQIYLMRVKPSIKTINDPNAYEFFAGYDKKGRAIWTKYFSKIKPLIDWNNHCGVVNITYNAPLKKYLMFVTDGWPTTKTMDSYILESDNITGPWKLVTYMSKFGVQGFFLNMPTPFISSDGRQAWLCYSANFAYDGAASNPPGSRPGMVLQKIKLLGPKK